MGSRSTTGGGSSWETSTWPSSSKTTARDIEKCSRMISWIRRSTLAFCRMSRPPLWSRMRSSWPESSAWAPSKKPLTTPHWVFSSVTMEGRYSVVNSVGRYFMVSPTFFSAAFSANCRAH